MCVCVWVCVCRLGSAGIKPLCKAIRNHPNINVLDVSANSIGAPGGEEIGALLTSCQNLTALDVSWNNLNGLFRVNLFLNMHRCRYTHAHTDTHKHVCAHTFAFAYAHAYIYTYAQAQMVHLCCRDWH